MRKDLLKSLRHETDDGAPVENKNGNYNKPVWLWQSYRENGYTVAMNENGCATSKRSLLKATRVGGAQGFRDGNWRNSVEQVVFLLCKRFALS